MTSTSNHPLRLVYLLFLAATLASFVYCLVLGQFNGDFFPQPVFLLTGELVFVLACSLLPYLALWRIAAAIERVEPREVFVVGTGPLIFLFVSTLGAHIVVTVLFGVGVMDQETYQAPTLVQPLIQVLNRIDPFYVGAFFILATRKHAPTDLLAAGLMITVGFLRAGLGAFTYVIIAFTAKYHREIITTYRKAPWLVLGALPIVPFTIGALYRFRGQLRGDLETDLTVWELIFGRFIGRLSSFSNFAYIQQYERSFQWASSALESSYFLKQGLVSVLGSRVAPLITPERVLISGNNAYDGHSTFMTGIPGNLFMSWNVSNFDFAMTLGLIFATVAGVLWLSRFLGNGIARYFGLAMLFYPMTSGVANEFALLFINTIFLVGFCMVFRQRAARRHEPRPAAG
jgi:hypothetical protein